MSKVASGIDRPMRLFALPPRDVTGYTTAGFWGLLGVAGLVFGLLLPESIDERMPILAGAASTIAIGAVVAWCRRRLPHGFHVAGLGFAIAAMSVMVSIGPSPVSATAMTALYTCVACHGALILPWRGAVATIIVIESALVLVAALDSSLPFWATIPAGTAVALIGVATAVLRKLADQAAMDPLTGVWNRRGFERQVQTWMQSGGEDQPLALILLDLDRFQTINDDRGHAYGDRVLCDVAQRWTTEVAGVGVIGRYGGDEFAVLLPGATEHDAVQTAERLLCVAGRECSAGVTSMRHGDSLSLFVGRADIGLYRSKNTGRGRVTVESAHGSIPADSIRTAIERRQLDVYLQPIVRLSAGERIEALEALIRWPACPDQAITPEGIVRTAEEHGLAAVLGQLVLERACESGRALSTRLSQEFAITVNISGIELTDPDYSDRVIGILQRIGWPAARLILEVTERDLEADSAEAIRQLVRLRAHGIRIAIDDFGTGYSSLTRIASIPCDVLKVDRAVVAHSTGVHRLLDVITAIAAAFDLEVVVEGIETADQALSVSAHGIDLAQGFLYSPPMPVDQFGH